MMPTYNPYMPTSPYQGYTSPYYQSYQPQAPLQPTQMSGANPVQQAAPVQPQVQAPSNPSTIIWVSGERQALEYPVMANSAVALWDSANPVIYLKQADSSGKPSTKIFDLVERVESPQNGSNAAGVDLSTFAEKTDLAAVAGVVSALSKDMESMKDELANLAGQVVKRAVGAKPKKEPVKDEDEED